MVQKPLVRNTLNKMLNDDEHWSNLTRVPDFQKQCCCGGAQSGVVSKKKADGVDHPFPNKPVIHRRPHKTQVPLGLDGFDKICISTQQRGDFLPKEYHADVTRKTTESRKSSQRISGGVLGMARAIHAKELILLEKLGKVEKKIRQTNQRDSADTETGDVFKSREERQHSRESKRETAQRARMSDYEDMAEAGWHDDFTIPTNKEEPGTEDRMRNTYEVQKVRWQVSQQVNSIHNKPRLQNANEPLRRKNGGEKSYKMWGKKDENYNEQNKAYLENTTLTREKKCKEKPHKNAINSDDKQNIQQKSLHKPVQRMATETQRSAERKLSTERAPVFVSNFSQRSIEQQQAELAISDNFPLLPCTICNRMFRSDRLETHVQICKKLKRPRPVYNMSAHRIKGTSLEEYFGTHTRSESPEVGL
ncbi:uncharacterized protein LOC124884855 isoform X2 [Girardinichthys multiradiatus]|uniref:uncharacterized protein LOC124884855 isoform X2 n=1 Tax=Girardinichthys multiradiatus TaxID=208333 RepID=UPI001FAB8C33|nr:uncharacterized protein LOC124884855 isoform X2 [Girardinichthys multiradiatus]